MSSAGAKGKMRAKEKTPENVVFMIT